MIADLLIRSGGQIVITQFNALCWHDNSNRSHMSAFSRRIFESVTIELDFPNYGRNRR